MVMNGSKTPCGVAFCKSDLSKNNKIKRDKNMSEHKNLITGVMVMLTLVLPVGVVSLPAQVWAEEADQAEVDNLLVQAQVEHSEIYNEAVASITKYNKLPALKAAVA